LDVVGNVLVEVKRLILVFERELVRVCAAYSMLGPVEHDFKRLANVEPFLDMLAGRDDLDEDRPTAESSPTL
jgi:hypothetical protein